jgi:hypothetical protein
MRVTAALVVQLLTAVRDLGVCYRVPGRRSVNFGQLHDVFTVTYGLCRFSHGRPRIRSNVPWGKEMEKLFLGGIY